MEQLRGVHGLSSKHDSLQPPLVSVEAAEELRRSKLLSGETETPGAGAQGKSRHKPGGSVLVRREEDSSLASTETLK